VAKLFPLAGGHAPARGDAQPAREQPRDDGYPQATSR
jgi:hypothetical protein